MRFRRSRRMIGNVPPVAEFPPDFSLDTRPSFALRSRSNPGATKILISALSETSPVGVLPFDAVVIHTGSVVGIALRKIDS